MPDTNRTFRPTHLEVFSLEGGRVAQQQRQESDDDRRRAADRWHWKAVSRWWWGWQRDAARVWNDALREAGHSPG
jgi:hypothetical protein